MYLGVVIQRKSGKMCIGHQFASPSSSRKTTRHIREVVGTGINVKEMRVFKPALHVSDCFTTRQRRRHYRRTRR